MADDDAPAATFGALGGDPGYFSLGAIVNLQVNTTDVAINEIVTVGETEIPLNVGVIADGFILEGPQSGIIVAKDDVLFTTPVGSTGILDSITVRHVLAGWQSEGCRSEQRLYRAEDLFKADAVWLASSVRLIRSGTPSAIRSR